jgi:hypothetical protein
VKGRAFQDRRSHHAAYNGGAWFSVRGKEEYLAYVVTEPKDIQTGICTGTKSLAGADPEMKQLDDVVAALNRCERERYSSALSAAAFLPAM